MTEELQPEEELLRNVHPLDFDNGRINSSAFNPSESHFFFLSVDRSKISSPEDCYHRHVSNRLQSAGVYCVSRKDFSDESIPTAPDPIVGNPAHALADFNAHGVSQRKKKAKRLAAKAAANGPKYKP